MIKSDIINRIKYIVSINILDFLYKMLYNIYNKT